MAAGLVGGALLSASLQFLFERIILNPVSAVLDDAERKQIKSRRVEAWLDELQEVVFDAEDLLDRSENHPTRPHPPILEIKLLKLLATNQIIRLPCTSSKKTELLTGGRRQQT
ncbi:hypothetical protein TIFTF001_030052 [Ficus carica]|uniref:Disease resistance N-terminal domain-containing protein n=1 Tax=Ficus carica TaxID=3494 RepID=A0AA88DSL1_FICCA|nr:hypothetical protein TIFTF001_030052 [Ficus carica]